MSYIAESGTIVGHDVGKPKKAPMASFIVPTIPGIT
jgi:hypothetical protein